MLRSLANALANISAIPDSRPRQWLEGMSGLAPLCGEPDEWLAAGQVLAWRAGLAHYRPSALALCRAMAPTLALAALGTTGSPQQLPDALSRLEADPWLDVPSAFGQPSRPTSTLKIVKRVGGFRGFGGPFLQPPRVLCSDTLFLAADQERCWLITADCYGATLHPIAEKPAPLLASKNCMDAQAERQLKETTALLEKLPDRTSIATAGPTLAVTIRSSHYVYLVAHG